MKKKKIVLHIGMTKTGTSALQHFLTLNRDALEEKGVGYYRPLFRHHRWQGGSNADALFYLARREIGYAVEEEKLREEEKALSAYIDRLDTVILSEEMLYGNGWWHNGFWPALRKVLTRIAGEDADLLILAYLRRQDQWVLSEWKELMRALNVKTYSFRTFLEKYNFPRKLDYTEHISRLERSFDREQIRIRPYEKRQFPKGDIFLDFLETAELSPAGLTWNSKRIENPSVSLDAAEALRRINCGDVPFHEERGRLYHASVLFSALYPQTQELYPIPDSERRAFLEQFREGNEALARRYGIGDSLFLEEIKPCGLWTPDDERDLKNARTIAALAGLSKKTQDWILGHLRQKKKKA